MQHIIHARSTIISLLLMGKISHILNPWNVIVNMQELTITIKKRNWFLIGFDTHTYAFRYVRSVEIDTHLFGADLNIRVMGATAKVFCIKKKKAKRIEDILIQYNNQKGSKHFVFH